MYFHRNLETEKVEIFFSKSEYQAMPQDRRDFIKRYCLFSRNKEAWISKAKIDGAWQVFRNLTAWEFEDRGTIGEVLSYAEKVENEQERAANKVEVYDKRHETATNNSKAAFNNAHTLGNMIPMGQPILVGHHSEGMHRRHLTKIDNAMRKGFEEQDKANHYVTKFNNALATAEGKKYQSEAWLVNRINECDVNLRTYERRLQGKFYHYSQPSPITEEERSMWTERTNAENEKKDYLMFCLLQLKETGEANGFDKGKLAGMKFINVRGRWHEIVRLNPKTVSVYNTCFQDRESQARWPIKYGYHEITEVKE